MKKLRIILFGTILLSACSSSNNDFEDFLNNFETKNLPFEIKADTTGNKSVNLKEIDEKYFSFFTDTANRFEIIDGKREFDTHYYYYGIIPNETLDFHTVIIANKMSEYTGETDKIHLEYNIYTISKEGKFIAKNIIAFNKYLEGTEYTDDLYSSAIFQNKTQFDVTEVIYTPENNKNITTTHYLINEDGTITKNGAAESKIEHGRNITLYQAFFELVNSNNFHGFFDYQNYENRDNNEVGLEVIEVAEGNYTKYKCWSIGGKVDTVFFQLLSKTENYDIYVFYNRGHNEVPRNYYNEIMLYKRIFNNYRWEEIPISKELYEGKILDNSLLGMFMTYNPKDKIISDFEIEEYTDEYDNFIQKKGKLKSQFKWSYDSEGFVKQQISDIPNPILVKNITTSMSEYANYVDAEIVSDYYREEQLKGKDMIRFAIEYRLAKKDLLIKPSAKIINDIVENKDSAKQFFIKYKTVKILENEAMGEPYEVERKIIEDYEIIGNSPVILTFERYYMSDLPIYTFKSKLGYYYSFDQIPENSYKLDKSADEANPEFVGKKFKITYHITTGKDDYSERILDYYIVDKIELIVN